MCHWLRDITLSSNKEFLNFFSSNVFLFVYVDNEVIEFTSDWIKWIK